MAQNPQRLQQKYIKIQERFRTVKKKNPKWRLDAVVEEVADEFYLEPITIWRILRKKLNEEPSKQLEFEFN